MTGDPREPTDADRDFARYCRDHDVDALARVFDATAPRLALVAAHLVGEGAEDLVQTTFLEALRSAERFEAGRPVMPWLLTILTRRAANQQRSTTRAARRRTLDVELDELAVDAPGPVEIVAERESVARIAAAIEQLDGGTREACALRLLHGLRPVDIARVLDRPLGTVHAQLHRGAQQLRRALPHALAVTVSALLGRDALAAARAKVLAAAHSGLTTATALVLAGITMKKTFALLAGVLVLLSIGFAIWLGPSAGANRLPRSEPVERRSAVLEAQAVDPDDPIASRSPVTDGVEPRATATSDLTFLGRVVRDEDGTPIAGVSVALTGYSPQPGAVTAGTSWTAPAAVSTDDDGRFRIVCAHDARYVFDLKFQHGDRLPSWFGAWEGTCPGITLDLGDLPLAPASEVRLRVIDADGKPVPGYRLQINEARPRRVSDARTLRWQGGGMLLTDAEGWYPQVLFSPGRWTYVDNESRGYLDFQPAFFEVEAGDAPRVIELLARRPEPRVSIHGIVVDQAGRPVPFAEMKWRHRSRDGDAVRDGMSRHDGSFEFRIGREGERATLARVGKGEWLFGREYELVGPSDPIQAGARDVRVVVRTVERGSVTLHVHDERGAPIEAYRVALVPVHHDATRHVNTWLLGRDDGLFGIRLEAQPLHEGGVRHWVDRQAGDWLLFVEPSDPARARVFARELTLVPKSDLHVDVNLPPRRRLRVRVVGQDGVPVEGSTVELIRVPGRGSQVSIAWTVSLHDAFERGVSGTYVPVITSSAISDGSGEASLDDFPDDGVAAVRVRGPMHRTLTLRLVPPLDPSLRIELRVEAAAAIHGALQPLDAVHRLGPTVEQRALAERFLDADQRLDEDRVEIRVLRRGDRARVGESRVADDGSFRVEGLPPGDYALQMNHEFGNDDAIIGEVEALRAGEVRRVTIDIASFVPASLRVRALVDGRPAPRARLNLLHRDGQTGADIDHDECVIPRLRPGRLLAQLSIDQEASAGGRSLYLEADAPLVLLPGEAAERTLSFRRGARLELRVLDEGGAPLRGRYVTLSRDEGGWESFWGGANVDDNGIARFASVPRGTLQVWIYIDNRPSPLGSVVVIDESERPPIELRMR